MSVDLRGIHDVTVIMTLFIVMSMISDVVDVLSAFVPSCLH
jgi:hypothetical protein